MGLKTERRKSKLEGVLETIDSIGLKEENFLTIAKKLGEAEKEDDDRYADEFMRYAYRSSNYLNFLNRNIENITKKQERFFLRKIIRSGKKACKKHTNNRQLRGSKIELLESKIGMACIDLAKNSAFLDFINKWCEKGIYFLKESIEHLIYYRSDDKTKKEVYSFTGQAFSTAYQIITGQKNGEEGKLDNLKESDLENLVMGIACQELSRDYGNDNKVNYQAIGRNYYSLQYLIEEADGEEIKEINIKKIKDKIREILGKKSRGGEDIFSKYSGGLQGIISLDDETSQLGKEMQFIAVKSSFEAFEESHKPRRGGEGDNSLDNESYQGVCLTDLVKLNNWLHKFDSNEARKMLEEAEPLLKKVVIGRKEEVDNAITEEIKKGLKEKLAKDYTRLAECKFRLADGDITRDTEERKKLYAEVIDLNDRAIALGRTISEVYGSIAGSHYKLAELSCDIKEKKKHLEEAVTIFESLFKKAEDFSAENRSKTGSCYIGLLELELEENKHSFRKREIHRISNLLGIETKIDRCIGQAKDALEGAIEKGKKKKGGFIYPYCLLAELSDSISDNKIRGHDTLTRDYNWDKVVGKLFEKENLKEILKPLFEEKEKVCVVNDEYGLMRRDLIVKESEDEEELKQEFLRNKFIYDAMKKSLDLASDSVPFSRPINFIQKDGKHYYVMRRSKGINLDREFKSLAGKSARAKKNENQ